MLPKVEDSEEEGQLRTLTQLILDFSEVRQHFPPLYTAYTNPYPIGNLAIFSSAPHGPICLSCSPRIVPPPLPTTFPIRLATQVSGLRALAKERCVEGEARTLQVDLR